MARKSAKVTRTKKTKITFDQFLKNYEQMLKGGVELFGDRVIEHKPTPLNRLMATHGKTKKWLSNHCRDLARMNKRARALGYKHTIKSTASDAELYECARRLKKR
jgi:hypothetical protein